MSSCNYTLQQMPPALALKLETPRNDRVAVLEHEFQVDTTNSDLLCELCDSLENEDTADIDLDYYLLDLLSSRYYDQFELENEFKEIVEQIKTIGDILLHLFMTHQLYIQNVLAYKIIGIKNNKIYMRRRDLFFKELQDELTKREFIESAGIYLL